MKLTFVEKIAMIWTLPLAVVLTIIFIIVSIVIFLSRVVLYFSGTAGAAMWIVDKIKQRWQSDQWKQIRERDRMSSIIDSMSK